MSSSKCARCDQTVYPVEGLRCLDKIWHKGCFKCHECNMTLNMNNYKGFEKRPYCNAHCPQAKATTVADTPEIRRLAENTRLQSQAKYHEEFEKSKGKGFTAIPNDPETLRIKETSKIISNVAYHGELERKRQMEEKRGLSGPETAHLTNNNNNICSSNNNIGKNAARHDHNNVQLINIHHNQPNPDFAVHQSQQRANQNQLQMQQAYIQSQHLQNNNNNHNSKQQHPMHYAQDHNGQQMMNRRPQMGDGHPMQQQSLPKNTQQQYPVGQAQQQQMIMRQQQQQQHIMLQQQRQSSEPNLNMSRQPVKHVPNNHPQQMVKHQVIPAQHQQQRLHQSDYVGMNEAMIHQPQAHLMYAPQVMNQSQMGVMANGQRLAPVQGLVAGPQGAHNQIIPGYNHHQAIRTNGGQASKQQYMGSPQRHMIHPSQMQQMNHLQMRSHLSQQQQHIPHHQQQQIPTGRVFRAMFDYVANDVDEVSFFENDILIDCVNVDGNWLIGKVARSGETGMLPANYVAELPGQ